MGETTGTFDLPESEQKAPRSPLRRAVTAGLIGGGSLIYLSVTGIVERFHGRNVITGADGEGILQLSRTMLAVALLIAGYVAARPSKELGPEGPTETEEGSASLGRGALAGAVATGMVVVLVALMQLVISAGMNPREIVVPISPVLLEEILRFGQGDGIVGYALLLAAGAVVGFLGAALHLASKRALRIILTTVGTTLLISLLEPMLRPMLSNLDISNDWLYRRGGLTVMGAVILLVVVGAIASFGGRERPAAEKPKVPTRTDREPTSMERGVQWGGIAGATTALAIVGIVFSGSELTSITLLITLLVNVAVLIIGVSLARQARRDGTRPPSAVTIGTAAGAVGLFVILPPIVGPFVSDVLGTVGLYILLGLGLNIVVGYAGLLDLGYVAFFAVGAYSMAILTSRASFLVVSTEGGVTDLRYAEQGFTNFWVALPLAVVIAVISGVLIGAPVLRLRGDYLAIVTLGFGEIIRTLVLSDWLSKWLGGAQGIIQIPAIPPDTLDLRDPERIYYVILVFALIAAFISYRLVESRVGRAWAAMREDESVAEAMGISVIKYKLLAFAMGAGVGSLGGVFFAAKIGSIFPGSFELLVSINVLAVIVLGGMGSIPGVVVGSLVLVGLPEMLREFAEYRLLFYGAILMAIMIYRPEGLLPNRRRQQELHGREVEEDQYEERVGAEAGSPGIVMVDKDEEGS